jgi:hypothetical protein
MRQVSGFGFSPDWRRRPALARAAAERRAAVMTWLAVVAGLAMCTIATFLR